MVPPFRSATIVLRIKRDVKETRSVLRCVTRHGKCAKYVYVTRFTHHDHAGRNRLTLSTRIGRKRLTPGKYRLEVTPEFKANFGVRTKAAFTVT